ncbi:MAG TPA: hypothetical protein VGZ93_12715 [Candidatus Methylacidiphilales bacterium]|jgi:hypothetical protein|nr:hypothetical protein [Candidatus Methylacidiphilales bacterium]
MHDSMKERYASIIEGLGPLFLLLKMSAAVVCLTVVVANIINPEAVTYNDGPLAPAFSILHGHPPFYPMNRGPQLNLLYGVLSYIYYIPCGIFGHRILWDCFFGSFLSFIAFAVPVGVILFRRRAHLDGVELVWLATLCALNMLFYSGLTYSAFRVHPDAPAVLLSCLCILSLDRRGNAPTSSRSLFLSATFAVLTAWTKQTYGAVVLLPLVVALVENHSWQLKFALAGWVALLHGLLFLFFSLWCGTDALVGNMFRAAMEVPVGQAGFLYGPDPGNQSQFRSIVIAAHILMAKYLTPYLLGFLLCMLSGLRTRGAALSGNLFVHVPRLAAMFFLVSLFNLPMTAKSAINTLGPSSNTDTSFAWFFILGVFCLIIDRNNHADNIGCLRLDKMARVVFITIALLSLAVATRHLPAEIKSISTARNNDETTVVDLCRQSPGKYYFPLNPLAAYLGEGKFYHWLVVVSLRSCIGEPMTQAHFNECVPPTASIVGLPAVIAPAYKDVLKDRVQNMRPCNGPSVPGADDFVWYSFERKP